MRTQTQQKNPFGVMQFRDHTAQRPTYAQIMLKHGLVTRENADSCWFLWTLLCEDRVVRKMSHEIEKPKFKALASITAGYGFYAQVLERMTPRQKAALKTRLGVKTK
jgi:hypothetical protein